MSEWRLVRLREIASHIKDGTHGTHRRVESGIPFLSAKNVGSNGRLTWNKSDDLVSESDYSAITATFTPKQGDLLLTIVGSIGRSALFDGSKVAFQRSVAFVRGNERVRPEYLFHASRSEEFTRQLERRSNVTAQAGLYLGELAKVNIPLPPTSKQQEKIAAILTSLDTAIEKTEALIEKHQQIKAGLMHDLFTRGVLPNGQLRPTREQAPQLYRQTSAGWLPQEWDVKRLGELVNPSRPISYGILMPGYGYPGGVPVIKVKDIKDRCIDDENLLLTSPSIDYEYRRSRLKGGDVLFTIRGSVGRLAIVPEHLDGANITQDTARLDLVGANNVFVSFYFETPPAQRFFEINTLGVAVQGINLGELRKTPVPLPSPDEQVLIAEMIAASSTGLNAYASGLKKLRHQKLGLMQDLLTGKVPVKVADPEAVPA
jgi:type I restriction enzyme S subunit